MIIKRHLILLALVLLQVTASGQVLQTYNLYYQDRYQINPASVGSYNAFNTIINANRSQVGMNDSPAIYNISVGGPLNEKVSIGTRYFNDSRGAFSNNSWIATYTYKIAFAQKKHVINFGLSAGVFWQDFKIGEINADMTDPLLLEGGSYKKTKFRSDVGLWYSWNNLNVGFSAPYLSEFYNHYLGYVSYCYDIPSVEKLILYPSLLYQNLPDKTNQVDVNLRVGYDFAWVSGTYRSNNNFVAAVGFNVYNFGICYAYEINSGYLNIVSKNTQEIMLTYNFNIEFPKTKGSYKNEKIPWEE